VETTVLEEVTLRESSSVGILGARERKAKAVMAKVKSI
jgi:hypothetical protein